MKLFWAFYELDGTDLIQKTKQITSNLSSKQIEIDANNLKKKARTSQHENDPIYMAADVRTVILSIRTSSPFSMAAKLSINNMDDAGTEFSTKNSLKNHLIRIFTPIFTIRPIISQDFNLIR